MKAINEVDVRNGEKVDPRYPITLLWANEHGEHLVVQAAFPVDLKNYLKDKTVTEIGALFFLGQEIPCEDMRHLEMFCND